MSGSGGFSDPQYTNKQQRKACFLWLGHSSPPVHVPSSFSCFFTSPSFPPVSASSNIHSHQIIQHSFILSPFCSIKFYFLYIPFPFRFSYFPAEMLGIPLLSTYIQRIVKVQSVADSVDWLNYYCTSLLLAFFALAISAKQYFGSPIQCWVPNEFKGSWERYTEDYCFVANSYFVPFEEDVPKELDARQDQISYYRWVPIALAIQALFFWLPNFLWNMLHKQTAINPRAVLSEAAKSRTLHGTERDKEIQSLASFVNDTLSIFHTDQPKRPSGLNATCLYLALKLVYVLNCFGQLVAMNRFLGGHYHNWAWESLMNLVRGEEWHESEVFPRVILCDFSVRLLANNQRHTVQCVIMLNLINEKLYFFLHFWFMLVGAMTLVNFFYYLVVLMLPWPRTEFVKRNINKRQQKFRGFGSNELPRFVHHRLRPDGILLLHFLRQHIGGRVTYELLNEMLRQHWLTTTSGAHSNGSSAVTASNASSSPQGSEKGTMMLLKRREEAEEEDPRMVGNGYSRQNTYKPTAYGPGALVYPGICATATAPPPFSPASLLRAISGTASPTITTTLMPNNNGDGNPYSMPPSLEYIDGNGTLQRKASSTMSTTPLAQSRRAKSPLITGLGSIGKRHGNAMKTPTTDEQQLLMKAANEEDLEKPAKSPRKIGKDSNV